MSKYCNTTCPNCGERFNTDQAPALGYRVMKPGLGIKSINEKDLWVQCPACGYRYTFAEEVGEEGPLEHPGA